MDQTARGDRVREVPGPGDDDEPVGRPCDALGLEPLVLEGQVRRVGGEVDRLGYLRVALANCLARRPSHDGKAFTTGGLHRIGHCSERAASLGPTRVGPLGLRSQCAGHEMVDCRCLGDDLRHGNRRALDDLRRPCSVCGDREVGVAAVREAAVAWTRRLLSTSVLKPRCRGRYRVPTTRSIAEQRSLFVPCGRPRRDVEQGAQEVLRRGVLVEAP